jgi:hypothetical protein
VVIVGNGFRTFSANFGFEEFIKTPTPLTLAFVAYFLAGYFFVITDFVFYQVQIEKYPYRNGTISRFFEDIWIFFLLYLLLDLASVWPTPRNLWAFLLILGLWHFSVMVWQLHVNFQYDRKWTCGMIHLLKSVIYFVVLGLYTYSQAGVLSGTPKDTPREIFMPAVILWVWVVVILIAISNGIRLHTLFKRK